MGPTKKSKSLDDEKVDVLPEERKEIEEINVEQVEPENEKFTEQGVVKPENYPEKEKILEEITKTLPVDGIQSMECKVKPDIENFMDESRNVIKVKKQTNSTKTEQEKDKPIPEIDEEKKDLLEGSVSIEMAIVEQQLESDNVNLIEKSDIGERELQTKRKRVREATKSILKQNKDKTMLEINSSRPTEEKIYPANEKVKDLFEERILIDEVKVEHDEKSKSLDHEKLDDLPKGTKEWEEVNYEQVETDNKNFIEEGNVKTENLNEEKISGEMTENLPGMDKFEPDLENLENETRNVRVNKVKKYRKSTKPKQKKDKTMPEVDSSRSTEEMIYPDNEEAEDLPERNIQIEEANVEHQFESDNLNLIEERNVVIREEQQKDKKVKKQTKSIKAKQNKDQTMPRTDSSSPIEEKTCPDKKQVLHLPEKITPLDVINKEDVEPDNKSFIEVASEVIDKQEIDNLPEKIVPSIENIVKPKIENLEDKSGNVKYKKTEKQTKSIKTKQNKDNPMPE